MHANISTQNTVMKLYSYLLPNQSKAAFIMYTLYFSFLFFSNPFLNAFLHSSNVCRKIEKVIKRMDENYDNLGGLWFEFKQV
jgi:hypothetical protein